MPRGLLRRAGRLVFFCLSRWRRHSPFSHEASVAIAGEWNTARRKRHSRRSATWGMVGVTEPEPCGLFVPNEDQVASVLAEHAQRCSLSVPFGGPAQQERPSPFLVRASGLREYLVGVTGFEPAASSSRTSRSPNYVWWLSTEAVRFVRLVPSGGPGFVPFLFPRRRSPPSSGRWLTSAQRTASAPMGWLPGRLLFAGIGTVDSRQIATGHAW